MSTPVNRPDRDDFNGRRFADNPGSVEPGATGDRYQENPAADARRSEAPYLGMENDRAPRGGTVPTEYPTASEQAWSDREQAQSPALTRRVETFDSPGDRPSIRSTEVTSEVRDDRRNWQDDANQVNSGAVHDRGTMPEVRAVPATGALDHGSVLAREKERFGGIKVGSAFFGWLSATGLAVLLIAILAAAGVAFGVTNPASVDQAVRQSQNGTGAAKTVGLVGAIVLLVILLISYYCGGYVAGRMARFNGAKQGFAVWLWAVVTAGIVAAVAAIAGSKFNVLSQLNLPRIPVNEGSVTTVGLIAIGSAVLVALIGAVIGGWVGTRFHRRVDAVGFEPPDAPPEGSPVIMPERRS